MILQVLQLRVARYTLGLGVRDISAYINISRTTISKQERLNLFQPLHLTQEQNTILIKIFTDKGLRFDIKNNVSLNSMKHLNTGVLTRFQLRASRTLLNISQQDLANTLKIEKKILSYLENLPNESYLKKYNSDMLLNKFKNFFADKGIKYPNDGTIELIH